LPGKFAPVSAGKILAKTAKIIMEEETAKVVGADDPVRPQIKKED